MSGKGLTKETLQELYADKTDAQIGEVYGLTGEGVAYYRKKWGIKTATLRQRRDEVRTGLPCLDDLTPAVLQELYQQMGDRQIAARYGVRKPAISRLRKRWGIGALGKSDRSTKKDVLADTQKDIIIGVMLGDGHLVERGALRVTHTHKQFDYLLHLHRMLLPLALPIFYEESDGDASGELYSVFGFMTVQHEELKRLRDIFYPLGHRIFPVEILEQLSPVSLAYWYQDDGHLDSDLPSFALGNITVSEADQVVKLIHDRFGLQTYLAPFSVDSSCKVLKIRAETAPLFFALVAPYMVPCMLYKLPQRWWPVGVVPKRALAVKGDEPLTSSLQKRSQSWLGMTQDERECLIGDLVEYWRGRGFPHPIAKPDDLETLRHLDISQVLQDGALKARQVGQSSCHAFMHHIWEAKSYDAKYSPKEIFENLETLKKALAAILNMGGVPNAASLRSAVRYLTYSGVYNFRPSAAKVLIDKYCRPGGVVFDPCAGYGGRLLGALLSNAAPEYIGCEPQRETYARLGHLVDWVSSYASGISTRVKLHNCPAEDFDFPAADMVLTSPPYWKREIYGDDWNQAGIRYPTYESWLDGFWKVVLQKAVDALRPGGWLVVNVDDFQVDGRKCSLIQDTLEIGQKLPLGEVAVLKYNMAKFGDRENHEKVLCWPKLGDVQKAPDKKDVAEIEFERCPICGRLQADGGSCPDCLRRIVKCTCCGVVLPGAYAKTVYCPACKLKVGAERARTKRKEFREQNPLSNERTFTCKRCGKIWQTDAPGRFYYCSDCKEVIALENRQKTCQYRHCGKSFVDQTPKNGMAYCCVEHRRREKLFRSGKVTSETQFRQNS